MKDNETPAQEANDPWPPMDPLPAEWLTGPPPTFAKIPLECAICGRKVTDEGEFMFAWGRSTNDEYGRNPSIVCKPIGGRGCWDRLERQTQAQYPKSHLQDIGLSSLGIHGPYRLLGFLDWRCKHEYQIIELARRLGFKGDAWGACNGQEQR
jgi:hypothetical protein